MQIQYLKKCFSWACPKLAHNIYKGYFLLCKGTFSAIFSAEPQTCNFIKQETLAQVFSCEFCEISNNTFCYKTPLVTASGAESACSRLVRSCSNDVRHPKKLEKILICMRLLLTKISVTYRKD